MSAGTLVLSSLSLAFACVVLPASSAEAEAPVEAGATVSANVGPLRNRRGSIGCRLYQSAEGFPRTTKGTTSRRVKVAATSARCSFERVPPGTYAIAVHHDENDNRKLDTNLIGIPLEGYGVSNNHTPVLSAPTWEESKFVVEPRKNVELSIALRYRG